MNSDHPERVDHPGHPHRSLPLFQTAGRTVPAKMDLRGHLDVGLHMTIDTAIPVPF